MVLSNVEGKFVGIACAGPLGLPRVHKYLVSLLFYSSVPSRSKYDVSPEIPTCSRFLL